MEIFFSSCWVYCLLKKKTTRKQSFVEGGCLTKRTAFLTLHQLPFIDYLHYLRTGSVGGEGTITKPQNWCFSEINVAIKYEYYSNRATLRNSNL